MHVHVNFGTAHSVRVICVKWVSVLCVKWVCRIWVSSSIFVGHSCKAVPYDVVRALEYRDIYTRTLARVASATSADCARSLQTLSLSRLEALSFVSLARTWHMHMCACVYMYMHMHMHMHMWTCGCGMYM